jgi:hypothetical protein
LIYTLSFTEAKNMKFLKHARIIDYLHKNFHILVAAAAAKDVGAKALKLYYFH